MQRRQFLRTTAAGGAILATSTTATAADESTGADTGTAHTVEMITEGSSYIFDPVGLHVQPGDTVEFVIQSGAHSATAYEDRTPEGAEAWDSGVLTQEGASFSYTFRAEGTYDYYCTPHKSLGMVGRIVCGEPGGPASGSTPPDDVGEGEFPTEDAILEQGSVAYPFEPGGGGGGGDGGTGTGGGPGELVTSLGLFGGIGLVALGVYLWVNSEGEEMPVGHGEPWRRRREQEGRRRGGR